MANTYQAYGQGDTGGAQYPPSTVTTAQTGLQPILSGYRGMTWCKVIWTMMFGSFSAAMSTPYSGQLFPTGSAQTTSGQSSPAV